MTTQSSIKRIVMHYSATYADQDIGATQIDEWHRARGFARIGYHYVIRRDGRVQTGRPENVVGAHVRGHNTGSIGICVVGGLDRATGVNVGVDNRTPAQIAAQIELTRDILRRHPGAQVMGHRDLVATQCPAYDAAAWWASVESRPKPVASQPLPTTSVVVQEPAQSDTQASGWLARLIAALVRLLKGGRA